MTDDDNETADAALVALVLAGDRDAFGRLYDRWFDRVLDLAYRIVWDADAAADVAQETFLSAWRNLGRLEDPNAFGAWLLHLARNAALDRTRRARATAPVDEEQLALTDPGTRPEDQITLIEDASAVTVSAAYVELLWDAAEALGQRDREVADLSLRHNMTPDEIAEVVGLNRNAAAALVPRVHQRLAAAVGARILWRGGRPDCAALRAELVEADVELFDDEAVRVIERHTASCRECSERKQTRVAPERLFAAIPIMVLPALKAKVAQALARQGAPMAGSDAMSWSAGAARGDRPPRRPFDKRRWLVAAAIVGGIILIGGIVAALAGGDDNHKAIVVVAASTTSTTRKRATTTTRSSTTSSSSSTTTSSSSTTTSSTTTPTTTPPTTPTTPPTTLPPIVVSFTLVPTTETEGYPASGTGAPTLSWSVTNVSRVHVYDGVSVFQSTKKLGSTNPCPKKNNTGPTCTAAPGQYVYTLDAYNSSNQLVLHRTVTLTINPS